MVIYLMTDNGGSSLIGENQILTEELQGEKELVEEMKILNSKKEILSTYLKQMYPEAKYITGSIEDTSSSPGYRRIEIRQYDNGTSSLEISMGDPNKAKSDFKTGISFSIHPSETETLINAFLSKKNLNNRQMKGLTLHIKNDGTTYTNSNLGTFITGNELKNATKRASLLLEQLTNIDTLSSFETEDKLPPKFSLRSSPEDHPEAPWN